MEKWCDRIDLLPGSIHVLKVEQGFWEKRVIPELMEQFQIIFGPVKTYRIMVVIDFAEIGSRRDKDRGPRPMLGFKTRRISVDNEIGSHKPVRFLVARRTPYLLKIVYFDGGRTRWFHDRYWLGRGRNRFKTKTPELDQYTALSIRNPGTGRDPGIAGLKIAVQ